MICVSGVIVPAAVFRPMTSTLFGSDAALVPPTPVCTIPPTEGTWFDEGKRGLTGGKPGIRLLRHVGRGAVAFAELRLGEVRRVLADELVPLRGVIALVLGVDGELRGEHRVLLGVEAK